MHSLASYELGDKGLEYVRSQLSIDTVFCGALLEVFDASNGQVSTLAPPGLAPERLCQFRTGGLLIENVQAVQERVGPWVQVISLHEEQAEFLKRALQQNPAAVCIADDYNPRWSEPRKRHLSTEFGIGEEVCHLLTATHDTAAFLAAVRCSDTIWHGVTAICSEAISLNGNRTAPPERLIASARTAAVITYTAYDGEGFVIWRKDQKVN